jgi:hypothetical protein
MDQKYIMQLAVEELQRQKSKIEAEIEMIRAELGQSGSSRSAVKSQAIAPAAKNAGRRRKRTAAERKAQSEKMRKIWAARRTASKK